MKRFPDITAAVETCLASSSGLRTPTLMTWVQKRIRSGWLLIPLAVVTWVLMHESGVHATVAGVLLAFTVPVVRSRQAGGPDAGPGLAEHHDRVLQLEAGPHGARLTAPCAAVVLPALVAAPLR